MRTTKRTTAGNTMDSAALMRTLKQSMAESGGTLSPELVRILKASGVFDALMDETEAHLENGSFLLAGDVEKLRGALSEVSGSSHSLRASITLWDGDHRDYKAAKEIIWNLPEDGPLNARVAGGFPHLEIEAVGSKKDLDALMKKLARFVAMDNRPSIRFKELNDG